MRYTLRQIIRDIETFANTHGQVSQFHFKDPLELLNDKESSFPCIDVVVRPSRFSGVAPILVSFFIEIHFMDLVHKDLSNEQDVLSDQAQIAMDLITYFDQPEFNDKFTIETNGQLLPFYEKGDNEMTGWTLGLNFKVIDLRDSCAIPTV